MKWWGMLLIGLVVGLGGFGIYQITSHKPQVTITPKIIEKPLLKYSIENLQKRSYQSQIVMDEIVTTQSAFLVQKFHFDSDGKNVTGLATIPNLSKLMPVIVQFRGYAEVKDYYPGYGTAHSAEEFAKNGFISIAPDFLGYGGSASPSASVWEARFETYTTAMNLLSAVEKFPMADPDKIAIWGHSNGGHIALTTAVLSKKPYPMVLWAPVSAGFPYSILYFMNDNSDLDRDLRQSLAAFEKDYDYKMFNPMGYLGDIQANILLQQGSADESVPQKWSDSLFSQLKNIKKDIKYEIYPGADHNLTPGWSNAVNSDVTFYKNSFSP